MRRMRTIVPALALIFSVFAAGCGGGTSEADLSDQAQIESLVAGDETGLLVEKESAEAAGALGVESMEPIERPWWFRTATSPPVRDITVHIENGTAEVTVKGARLYHFNVDVDHDGHFGRKEAHHESVRHAVFTRRPGRWFLQSVSMAEVTMADDAPDTIAIHEVIASAGGKIRWQDTDPGELMYVDTGLPVFFPGEQVLITAEVENTASGVAVYLHDRAFRRPGHARHPMHDDGTHGDEVPGDGIFTSTCPAPHAPGYYHIAVDAIDSAAFEDESTENYRATAWIFPYRVVSY